MADRFYTLLHGLHILVIVCSVLYILGLSALMFYVKVEYGEISIHNKPVKYAYVFSWGYIIGTILFWLFTGKY